MRPPSRFCLWAAAALGSRATRWPTRRAWSVCFLTRRDSADALHRCSFVEPLAAGSGIPEVKTYLNGVHIRGLLTIRTLVAKLSGITFSIAAGLIAGGRPDRPVCLPGMKPPCRTGWGLRSCWELLGDAKPVPPHPVVDNVGPLWAVRCAAAFPTLACLVALHSMLRSSLLLLTSSMLA